MTVTLLLGLSVLANLGFLALLLASIYMPDRVAPLFFNFEHFSRATRERIGSQFASLDYPPGSLVFLGDSLTAEGQWAWMFPGRPVVNLGIAGDTVRGVASRLGQALDIRPAAIVLMIGTNDISRRRSPDAVAADLEGLLAALRAGSPATPVLLQSVLPQKPLFANAIRRLNRALAALAARDPLVRFLDLDGLLAGPDGELSARFTNDGVHLNGAAYLLWRDALRPALDDVLRHGSPDERIG